MKKGVKIFFIVFGSIMSIFILLMILANTGDFEEEPKEEPEPVKELTAEERFQQNIEDQFSPWNGSHMKLVDYVKRNMNDPKSFEHVQTKYMLNDNKTELELEMKFRGKNAFGAMVLNTVYARADVETGEILEIMVAE